MVPKQAKETKCIVTNEVQCLPNLEKPTEEVQEMWNAYIGVKNIGAMNLVVLTT